MSEQNKKSISVMEKNCVFEMFKALGFMGLLVVSV